MAPYEELALNWEGFNIQITLKYEVYGTDFCHIEVTCNHPLPITETGYRSHFIHKDILNEWNTLSSYIRAWLNEAAKSKEWKRQKQARQQLSFDL